MRKFFFPLLFAPLFLTACMNVPTNEISAGLDTFVGRPLSDAIRTWGPPARTFVSDGTRWNTWVYSGSYVGNPATCEWSLETAPNGRVVSSTWNGHGWLCHQLLAP